MYGLARLIETGFREGSGTERHARTIQGFMQHKRTTLNNVTAGDKGRLLLIFAPFSVFSRDGVGRDLPGTDDLT